VAERQRDARDARNDERAAVRGATDRDAIGESVDAEEDLLWLERVRDVYTPEPMTTAEQRAFDARLEQRIDAAARRGPFGLRMWQPIAAVAVAAAAAWLTYGTPPEPSPTATSPQADFASMRRPASLADWEREILAAAEPEASTQAAANDRILPDEYQAIDGLFLAGGGGAIDAR
jgi:hypothetical protein